MCRDKFTRFFPAYKLTSLPPTPIETLESAAHIADDEGLQYVYIGNYPGHERNSTFCPGWGEAIIWRTLPFSRSTLRRANAAFVATVYQASGGTCEIWQTLRVSKTLRVSGQRPTGGCPI
jgi:hypothetical protein